MNERRTNIRTYDLAAAQYDTETADFWDKFPPSIMNDFKTSVKKGVRGGGRVLDLGSGPGRDGLILQQNNLPVVCLDAARSMVNLTKQKGLPSLLADFNQLPFASESFAGVWAYTSLLHIPKSQMKGALQEIRRVLMKGGILGLGMIEEDYEGYRWSLGPNFPRYFAFYAQAEIYDLLTGTGFDTFYFERFQPESKYYLHFLARKAS